MADKSVSEIISEAAGKTAKDLNLQEEESTEQSGAEAKEETEETQEEESTEEESTEVEDEQATTEQQTKKSSKMIPVERFNEVYGKMKQMERYLAYIAPKLQQMEARPEPKAEKEEALPENLEDLTNSELFGLMRKVLVKDVKGALKEAVSPLSEFVGSARQQAADKEVSEVAAANPDYFDYAEQMVEISNRNPSLTAKEAYLLAKGDKGAAQKSVIKRIKAKQDLKKKANTEKRSSSVDKIEQNKEFKTIREAGLAQAKKLGLL